MSELTIYFIILIINFFILFFYRSEDMEKSISRTKITPSSNENKCERTFISFENDIDNKVFDSIFKSERKKKTDNRRKLVCAITKLQGKYFDPVTQLPYRNVHAFKILREAYYQQLEEKGDAEKPEVSKWLQWRKRVCTFNCNIGNYVIFNIYNITNFVF